jgi:hypothetical protein
MKKIVFTFLLLFSFFQTPTLAQTVTIPMPTTSIAPTPIPSVVNYELPYPGLLPGSPIYPLKALRDRFAEIMISDPLRKSNFYLLQADKRLAAGILLHEQGKRELGETTISKSLNYLEKSFDKMVEAKKSQKNVLDIYGKIRNSANKQKLEIERLSKNAKGEHAQKLKTDYKRAEELLNRAEAFKP